ncbi:hypothetical protein ON003_15955 [Janibacter hoylei]|uniref:hypothetical protein n=1 Tax=Janibacter hoylei TaxID=364298 RepID=UPI0022375511|nr:hypothetical protein [Janibacter hoylei]MCW4602916.1 hypothetical protein [Janibacter hoylei]
MDLTWVALSATGLLSIAGLPFAMAWVERTLMTGPTHVEQPPRATLRRPTGGAIGRHTPDMGGP